jgi:hypothetical protein
MTAREGGARGRHARGRCSIGAKLEADVLVTGAWGGDTIW